MPKTDHWQWYVERFAETEFHHHAVEETYYAGTTAFQDVAVIRTATFGKMLVLDGDTQSSQFDEKIYHESLVHPALAATADRRRGARSSAAEKARRCARRCAVRTSARCTMVDIDGEVVDLSKKFLPEWSDGAFENPRARVIVGDALAFLREDRGSLRHDRLGSDGTARGLAVESCSSTTTVFRDIKARLADGGVYVLQASTAGFHNMSLHAKMARTLREPLPRTCARSTRTSRPSTTTGRSSRAATRSTSRLLQAARPYRRIRAARCTWRELLLRCRDAPAPL